MYRKILPSAGITIFLLVFFCFGFFFVLFSVTLFFVPWQTCLSLYEVQRLAVSACPPFASSAASSSGPSQTLGISAASRCAHCARRLFSLSTPCGTHARSDSHPSAAALRTRTRTTAVASINPGSTLGATLPFRLSGGWG